MKNVLRLFLMDLKKIVKAPAALVILAGLCILPSFYAWFNLDATWDPYGNTKNIKIGVVNEDKGATIKDKKINVGNKMEEMLKKNKKFDWQFVSREKADHDLRMGEMYAAIYVPDKFTHQITGTLRKDPQQADVEYKVNQKINAIAPKMTDAATNALVKNANDKFNETVTKALLDEANKAGIKLEDQVPTINKISDAVQKANDSIPEINKLANKIVYLDENQDQLDDYANRFRNLENYKGEILGAQDKLNQVNAAIPALNERAKLILALNEYIPNIENALNVASNDVPQKVFPRINRGVDLANQGVNVGLQGLDNAETNLALAKQRVGDYQEAIGNAQDANNQINNNLQTNQQSTANESNIKTTQLATDGNTSNDQVPSNGEIITNEDLNAMETSLSNSLISLSNYANSQTEANKKDLNDLKNISSGIIATNNPGEFKAPLDNLISRLETTSNFNQRFIDILSNLENSENVDLSREINEINSANNRINDLLQTSNQLRNAISNGSSGKEQAVNLLRELPRVNEALNDFSSYIRGELNQRLLTVSNDITSVLARGDARLSTLQSKLNTIDGVIDSGKDILNTGKNRIENIQSALPQIEQRYMDAMATAQAYFPRFKEDVGKAASFVQNDLPRIEQRLADTTATVNETLPTIFSRYDQLLGLLNNNQAEFKERLHDTATFIKDKLPNIEKDIIKANKALNEIEDEDVVDNMIDLLKNDLKKQANVIANPVNTKQTDVFPVKDYGSASTPFYTALSLWVGALLLVSLLTTDNKHKELAPDLTMRQTYLGKMQLFYLIGILQALIVSIGDIVILHADVEEIPWFIGSCVFISLMFISIVYTLVSLLGNPGKALAIIMLVLQIAGGGGTFPIEVTPEFFQTIHPFLPFSHAINALRETVGGIVPEILFNNLGILALFGLGFLLIGFILKPITEPIVKKVEEKAEKSEIME